MPLQARRPNLPSLTLPGSKSSLLMVQDVLTPHTPQPFTPLPFEQGPMVMTPDTPSFDLNPMEIILGDKQSPGHIIEDNESEWTEEEQGVLQSYLAHPPRALRTAYPPGTLPPPDALDEITNHLINSETRKSPTTTRNQLGLGTTSYNGSENLNGDGVDTSNGKVTLKWKHSWNETRQKLFNLARQESMESIGGHRRKESDSIIPSAKELFDMEQQRQQERNDAVMKPQRPRLAVLGGQKMNRQQHSMDNLYGDEKPQTFQEALRLSSNLQVNSLGNNEELHSGSGLSSPLTFSFNLPATVRKSFPFSAPSTFLPRPASLLQRGRSFTSEDFAREHAKGDDLDDFALDDIDTESRPGSPARIRPENHRSVSSPVSILYSSPPSSISSHSELEHDQEQENFKGYLDVDMGEEEAPITPVNQTFSALSLGINGPLGSQCSTPTVSSTPLAPPPIVQQQRTSSSSTTAPQITLTVMSPERSNSAPSPNPSVLSTSPSEAFSNLSLSLGKPRPFTDTSSPMKSRSVSAEIGNFTGGIKRSFRQPPQLNRSLSDSGLNRSSGNTLCGAGLSMTTLPLESERNRENKRQKSISGMKFGPSGVSLSVVVPKRIGINDELRSPFEMNKGF
ncbi:uncharacterized protein IL334_000654 [Kwoniella shivajii]|uniref:Uncharacterized protein n=1 Tax=Kwoniella shivajii TaxID=564305 RepID=A0ABZ1CPR8_9TREE|nr:hypothetical protein IL334_000654 [Kwoniella shivajii]